VCGLLCEKVLPIDRISIRGDLAGALGFVRYADPLNKHVISQGQLLDSLCVLFGGREAEDLLLDDLSIGSSQDLEHATAIARSLVEELGMGDAKVGTRNFRARSTDHRPRPLSETTRAALDRNINNILAEQQKRARKMIEDHRALVVALRDLLLERKVLDRASFAHLLEDEERGESKMAVMNKTTLRCDNDGYCHDVEDFDSVEQFLAMCQDCFGEQPELRPGRDRDGCNVWRNEYDEIVLYEVAS
jgi:ATP-dependent Zn protease